MARTDITLVISRTLNIITDLLKSLRIPIIIYIDLYLLYEYLVKLGTIKEKRLIIDIIAL